MIQRIPALVVAIGGSILYVWNSFPFPDWLDSPELITAAHRLGMYHPPGSPLAVLLGHLFQLLPFACPARSMLCFSAVFAGAGLYVFTRTIQDLWVRFGSPDSRLGLAFSFTAGTAFALSAGLWSQAVRCEVYTLGLFLFLCSLRELLSMTGPESKRDRIGPAFRLAAYTGMGLAVHPLMALSIAPGFLVALSARDQRNRYLRTGEIIRGTFGFLLGAAPLGLLPLFVHESIDLRWGDPASLSGWIQIILGTTFSPTFAASRAHTGSSGAQTLLAIGSGSGFCMASLGLLGVYLTFRLWARFAAMLLAVGLGSSLSLILQRTIRLDNPDVTGYALPAIAICVLFMAIGLAMAARMLAARKSFAAWIVVPICLTVAGADLTRTGLSLDRSGCTAGRRMASDTLQGLPEGTNALVADFNLVFMLDYLIRVERLRADVHVFYLKDLDNAVLRRSLRESRPVLEAALPGPERLSRSSLQRLLALGPVALDSGLHLDPASLAPWSFGGLVWILSSSTDSQEASLDRARVFYNRLAPPVCTTGNPIDARSADRIAWHAYWQAMAAQSIGWQELARHLATVSRCASPHDATIEDLAQRLGLVTSYACPPEEIRTGKERALRLDNPCRRTQNWPVTLLLLCGLTLWMVSLVGIRHRFGFRARLGSSLAGLALIVLALLFGL